MLQHVFLSLLMYLFMLAVVWLSQWYRFHHGPAHGKSGGLPRRLKPRTPQDCPACCLAASSSSPGTRELDPVRPWREVKSRRGAPKRVKTEGFACPNQACVYDGISDADVHAIVSDGSYGKAEWIQRWRCQACGSRFSARLHTPLYRLKTPSYRVALVLGALAEGLDVSAAERVFGIRHATITRWLPADLHQRWPQCLLLRPHCSLWTLDQGTEEQEETVAGGRWPALWPGQKELPTTQVSTGQAGDPVGDWSRLHRGIASLGLVWTRQHRLYRARQPDAPSWRGGSGTTHLDDGLTNTSSGSPSALVASLLSLRATPRLAARGVASRTRGRCLAGETTVSAAD